MKQKRRMVMTQSASGVKSPLTLKMDQCRFYKTGETQGMHIITSTNTPGKYYIKYKCMAVASIYVNQEWVITKIEHLTGEYTGLNALIKKYTNRVARFDRFKL